MMDDDVVINLWRREALEYNPYYRTAFHAIGIAVDETSLQAIGEYVQDRIAAIRRDPDLFTLGPHALTESVVVEAEKRLFDPNQRILEELLIHKPVQPTHEGLSTLRSMLLDALPAASTAYRLDFLYAIIHDQCEQMLAVLPLVDVPPFPVDEIIIPPFGVEEGDSE